MTETEGPGKYLIHAEISADGIVERSDVVGAIFGQTEGLLGARLDLRHLQESSKVGRLDVEIDSHDGESSGEVTIATSLDKIETATVAAALETIDRIGPCRATVTVTAIEDVRAAKRRAVVDRAEELLAENFDGALSSDEIIDEVRERLQREDVTTYEGQPAGPQVTTSDALVLVEGRADVIALLEAGIKNAVAVEGTNVPNAIAELTKQRRTTAFLDGDRGGELIFRELQQVAALDYITFAPAGQSVEDLSTSAILDALQQKVPAEAVEPSVSETTEEPEPSSIASTDGAGTVELPPETKEPTEPSVLTVPEHAESIVGTDTFRALDEDGAIIEEGPVETAFETGVALDSPPKTLLLDGPITQRVLDLAAQRGITNVIGTERGDFTKQPTDVRLRTIEQLREIGTI